MKKIVITVAVVFAFVFGFTGSVALANEAPIMSVVIDEEGEGTVPAHAKTPVQGQMLARRAAIVDCCKKAAAELGAPRATVKQIYKEGFVGKKYVIKAAVQVWSR